MAQKYKKDSCWHRFLLEITFSNVPPEKLVKLRNMIINQAPSKHTKEVTDSQDRIRDKNSDVLSEVSSSFRLHLCKLFPVSRNILMKPFLNQMKESVPLPNSHTLNVLFSFPAAKGDLLKHDTHLYQKDPHIHVYFYFSHT